MAKVPELEACPQEDQATVQVHRTLTPRLRLTSLSHRLQARRLLSVHRRMLRLHSMTVGAGADQRLLPTRRLLLRLTLHHPGIHLRARDTLPPRHLSLRRHLVIVLNPRHSVRRHRDTHRPVRLSVLHPLVILQLPLPKYLRHRQSILPLPQPRHPPQNTRLPLRRTPQLLRRTLLPLQLTARLRRSGRRRVLRSKMARMPVDTLTALRHLGIEI